LKYTYLDAINEPEQIKSLSFSQLEILAAEIRDFLIATVSKTGGHLASNLGVVELTLALHKVFHTPQDKLIWDVGHQSYVHKILTGRRKMFATLRQFGGISGFPKPKESPHDAFATGHATTSISAALGMALARDLAQDDYHVVAIIGDGSLTGGQAYEALNHAGQLGVKFTVILNDNEMSIAKNVGAISEFLAGVRTDPAYSKVKKDVETLVRRIPTIGDTVFKGAERVKDSLKYLLTPGAFFERLGFSCFGPIDGHKLSSLVDIFQRTKNIERPVLIHVNTCKGKGYSPAENKADKFHGIGPFCIETGETNKSDQATYTKVFGDTLVELAKENKDLVAITAAMPEGTGLLDFAKTFPKRFFDVGIAEPHAITMAAGLAAQGKRPVVAIYSTFVQRAYDHLLHDVCLQNLPVIIAIDRAGIVGEDGETHQGVFDYSFLRSIPNLTIMVPKDENELRHLLYTAVNYCASPVAIRYPRAKVLGVEFSKLAKIPLGQAEWILPQEKLTFLALGSMVETCRKAAEILKRQGIKAGVLNMRFLKPLDSKILAQVFENCSHLVTVEDNVLTGGFGSAVLESMNTEKNIYKSKVLRLGLPDEFITHGTRDLLLQKYNLDEEAIAAAAKTFFTGKRD
jgi:1-deoxy-D-xylulose-5-phosphate synthase